jgi:hypothetical protein
MSNIFATSLQIVGDTNLGDTGVDGWLFTWSNIGNADTPMPISFAGYADKSFQAEGTFGGTTVSFTGSNDSVNFHNLRDPAATTIAMTSADLKEVLEHTLYMKPALTGGSGSSITATLFVRKTQSK